MNDTKDEGEAERQKVIEALKAGRVRFAPDLVESLKTMDMENPDFAIVETRVETCWGPWERNLGGFEVRWRTRSAGAGSTTIYRDRDGRLRCENEGMGPEFLKSVFADLVDRLYLEDAVR